jgi:hypothetical protein
VKEKLLIKYAWVCAVACALIVMLPSLNNGWVNWDDQDYVLNNPLLRDFSIQGLTDIFTTIQVVGIYHPVTIISLAIDYQLGGQEAFVYHLHSLLLHLGNTYLCFVFIDKLFKRRELAFFVALLFAIHPMHVESVAWISARKDLLSTFYLLLCLIAYVKYDSKPDSKKYYALSFVFFVISILSKSVAVVAPLYLLLIDYLNGRLHHKKRWLEKVPFLVLSVCFSVIAYFAQDKAGAIDLSNHLNLFERLAVSLLSLLTYLFKAVFPFNLAAFHPYPIHWGEDFPVLLYGLLAAVPVVAWWLYINWSNKYVVFGLLFFAVSLLPVLQILPVGRAIIADRYSYVSYVGLFVLFGYLFFEKWPSKALNIPIRYRVGTLIIVLTSYAVISVNQMKTWRNGETLWSQVIEVYPDHYFAFANRADYYLKNDKLALALDDLNKSIQLNHTFPKSFHDRGKLHFEIGNIDEAINDYTSAIDLDPTYSRAYLNRAQARGSLNQLDLVLLDLDSAIQINPFYSLAYLNRAVVHQKTNQSEKALNDFNKAIELEHQNGQYYRYRAVLKIEMNDMNGAFMDLEKAIVLNPNDKVAKELVARYKSE